MTDNAGRDLGYGRLGPIIYDEEEKKWQYGRFPGLYRALRAYGTSQELLSSPTNEAPVGVAGTSPQRSLFHFIREFKTLTKRHPELQLAHPFFTPFARESEYIQTAAEKYDPLIGGLLAYGSITVAGDSTSQSIDVVGVTSGDTGERLLLYRVKKRTQRAGNGEGVRLAVPSPTEVIGSWIGPGVPIRQIIISKPRSSDSHEDEGREESLVAVRLWRDTVILQPALGDASSQGSSQHTGRKALTSQIDLQQVTVITEEMTGGLEHADVALNPWRTEQLAIVDCRGSLSLFEISINPSGANRSLQDYPVGNMNVYDTLFPSNEENETEDKPSFDWWRLLWIENSNTILVCTRIAMALIDVRHMSTIKPKTHVPKLGLKASSNWILGIRQHPSRPGQVFILTSTHVFWLYVCFDQDQLNTHKFQHGLNVLVSIRHFRGSSDLSLKLAVSITEDEGADAESALEDTVEKGIISLLLYSGLNTVVTCYRVQDRGPTDSHMILCDPVSLVLGYSGSSFDGFRISSLILLPLQIREASHERVDSRLIPSSTPQDLELFDLQILTTDLCLRRQLLCTEEGSSSSQNVEFTRGHAVQSQSHGGDSEMDKIAIKSKGNPMHAALDMRPVYRLLQERTAKTEDVENTVDAIRSMEGLYHHIEGRPGSCGEPIDSLINQVSAYSTVDDIDDASRAFQDLLKLVVPADAPDELPLIVKRLSGGSISDTSLSSVYRSIIKTMLAPLPSGIPGRFRLILESQARITSTDVCLASARTQLEYPERVPGPAGESQEFDATAQQLVASYPSSPGYALSSQPLMPTTWNRSASMPPGSVSGLPSPSTTPSVNLSMISNSAVQASYATLQRYVAFDKPLPTAQSPTGRALAHWAVGVDPATYSWTSTQHAIEIMEERAVEESGMTATQRRKMQLRAEKLLKKQRAEAKKREERIMETSSQPVVVATSDRGELLPRPPIPVPAISQSLSLPFLSSQPMPSQSQASQVPVVVASQTEPGRHGGRMGPPPRKKKRKGFG